MRVRYQSRKREQAAATTPSYTKPHTLPPTIRCITIAITTPQLLSLAYLASAWHFGIDDVAVVHVEYVHALPRQILLRHSRQSHPSSTNKG